MSVDELGREYKELYFNELIDLILAENRVNYTLDEKNRKKFLLFLYDNSNEHLNFFNNYNDYETYKSQIRR